MPSNKPSRNRRRSTPVDVGWRRQGLSRLMAGVSALKAEQDPASDGDSQSIPTEIWANTLSLFLSEGYKNTRGCGCVQIHAHIHVYLYGTRPVGTVIYPDWFVRSVKGIARWWQETRQWLRKKIKCRDERAASLRKVNYWLDWWERAYVSIKARLKWKIKLAVLSDKEGGWTQRIIFHF